MPTLQDTAATPTPETNRDDKGRFRKGNPGGPGNPFTLGQRMGRANHSPTDDNGNIGAKKNGKPPSGNGSNGRL